MPKTISKFLGLCLSILLLPFLARATHCTVAQIAIIPGTWDDTTTKTSLTLQAQDSAGASCHAVETLRFSLQSTNASGTFITQTGNALTYSISSGTWNRNFYYENNDTSAYTLTAKAGYGPSGGWVESFSTTYSNTSNVSTSTATTTGNSTPSSDESSPDAGDENRASSAHYGSSALGSRRSEPALSLGAGQDRLGSAGSPMEFKAEVNFNYTRNGRFTWNFGDGTERDGEVLSHTYEHPGEYVVVLNASFPEGSGVSRINVKIIEPQISIVSATPEKIELKNNSAQEVSLYGRALMVGGQAFLFPKDTIVRPGQTIAFSSKITNLAPRHLAEAQLLVLGQTEQPKLKERIEEAKTERIAYLKKEIAALESRVATIRLAANANMETRPAFINNETKDSSEESVTQTANAFQSMSSLENQGWFATLRRFFLRKERN